MKQIFNLKSYLTFLSRNKVYTAINVFGLSVSLMFVILLVVFVQQEYSVDTQHAKGDRIYLFAVQGGIANSPGEEGRIQCETSAGLGPEFMKRIPGIESTCAVSFSPGSKVWLSEDETMRADFLYADTTFYQMFDFELTQGDKLSVLSQPENVIVSEAFAHALFGDKDPMGRHVRIDEKTSAVVAGVFSTLGNTALKQPDLILPLSQAIKKDSTLLNYRNNLGSVELFLLAKEGNDLSTRTAQFYKLLKEIAPNFFNSKAWAMKPAILPLKGLYLSKSESYMSRRGDAKMVRIFTFVALIILLFSVMNYINLTVAQSGYRAREMASRRLFGAQRSEIVLKLITESVALCLLSLAIGLALALWLAPYIGKLLNGTIDLSVLTNLQFPIALLMLTIFIGILAGIIPAIIQSRAKPIEVVRGTFHKTTRMFFSRVFIIVQNVITIALIASALTIYYQIRHLVNAPLGFEHKNVMSLINTRGWWGEDREEFYLAAKLFRDEAMKLPCVEQVALSNNIPFSASNNGYHLNGKNYWFTVFHVDENWLPMLGIKIEKDYQVSGDGLAYVNRHLMDEIGLKPDARDWLPDGDEGDGKRELLHGIIDNFRVGDINDAAYDTRGIVVHVWHNVDKAPMSRWLIKLKGDPEEASQQVLALYKKLFKEDFYDFGGLLPIFIDQQIALLYESQQRLLNVVALFAVIAVLISLMGLIAMSTYFIQQRRKEIAIRKVYGSTSRQIWSSLVRTFLLYVGIAFVIAAPIVWHFMGDWLSEFNYRIQLWPWILVAGFTCFIISFAAVFIQSFLASNENPINHIKDNG